MLYSNKLSKTFQDTFSQTSKIILTGLSGTAAVLAQTLTLSWLHNFQGMRTQANSSSSQTQKLVSLKGVRYLYKGQLKGFHYTAMARFGDLISNVTVMDYFKNHRFSDIRQTPLYLQTAFVWTLASIWRLMILPLDFSSTLKITHSFSMNRFLINCQISSQQRIRQDITPLYSWFLVSNYLMAYTDQYDYHKNFLVAVARNSSIGFASMTAYDLYKLATNRMIKILSVPRFEFSLRKTFVKGLYGVVFCNVTQLISQRSLAQQL